VKAMTLRRCAAYASVVFTGSLLFGFPALLVLPTWRQHDWPWITLTGAAWAVAVAVGVGIIRRRASSRVCGVLLRLFALMVVLAFAIEYPKLNTDTGGSDRDDDADIAVRAAFDGEYPFSPKTYLGNSITHMPGGLVLAAPFVAAGTSALQNIVAIPLAIIGFSRSVGRRAAVVATALAGGTSWLWFEVINGGDTVATMIYVTASGWLVYSAKSSGRRRLLALLLGVALCTRANVWPAAAPVFAAIWAKSGRRAALEVAAIAAGVVAVLTTPFLIPDPSRYTPLSSGATKFFAPARGLFPMAQRVIPAVAVASSAAVGSAVAFVRRDIVGLLAGIAAAQLVQCVVLLVMTPVVHSGFWATNWSFYIAMSVIPGAAAVALSFSAERAVVDGSTSQHG
jgi:hypothetical protein